MPEDKAVMVVDAVKAGDEWRVGLALREQAFVEEYLVDLNQTAACIRAGYSKKTAAAAGARLRKKCDKAIQALFESRGISKLRIIEEYSKVAFANINDYVKVEDGRIVVTESDKLTADQLAAISEISETVSEDGTVSLRIKPYDKLTALSWLGKAMRMFVERQEVSGPNGGAITVDAVVDVRARIAARLDRIAEARARSSAPTQPDTIEHQPKLVNEASDSG